MSTDASTDDDALLERWQQGDTAAGNRLLRRHRPAVVAYFRVRRRRYADDLTQATIEKVIIRREAIRPGGFRAYVMAVARSMMLRHLRDWPRREFCELSTTDPVVAHYPLPPDTLDDRARLFRAIQAMQRLPRREQHVLDLHLEGKDAAEIAAIYGVAVPTARLWLHRARQAMLLDESTAAYPARPGYATVRRDGAFIFVPLGAILPRVEEYFRRAQGFGTVDDVVDAVTAGRATGSPIPRCGALLQAALRQGRLTVEPAMEAAS